MLYRVNVTGAVCRKRGIVYILAGREVTLFGRLGIDQ
jgi:hypothetical protein